MKIGINARTFSSREPGGAVQTAIRITKELASRDHDVVLFGHQSIKSQFQEQSVEVDGRLCHTKGQGYGIFWERTVLPYIASHHSVDLLYCPNGNSPPYTISTPIVTQIHDVSALNGYSNGLHQTYRKLTIPRAVDASDMVVTVSKFSKQQIHTQLGVPESKIQVVYNGVDDFFRDPARSTTTTFPDPYILFVGAMSPRKNVSRLVDAFAHLKDETDIQHSLVLIGPEKEAIFETVDIGDRDDILTPGYLSRGELKTAYTNAELFVYPSLYEGFGLPPLEAMACGTPVVASNTTSLPEVLNGAAALVDPTDVSELADAMFEALTDAEYRATLTEKGRKQSARYTWEGAGRDLIDVFEQVV